jgi:hypothetical protein
MFSIEDTRIQILILSENINRQVDLRVMGVHGDLVLWGIANQTFVVREGDIV